MDTDFKPERIRRPREQVELQIRSAILSGAFRVGDRLPSESALARSFGVSRGTVREALRALTAVGLISTAPGATGGSFVEGLNHNFLAERFGESVSNVLQLGTLSYEEVADVRSVIEVPAVRLAARNRDEEHLERLSEIIEREKSVDVTDPEVPELDAELHRLIAEASRNRLLALLVSALHHVAQPLGYIEITPQLGRETVIQHLRIFAAVRDRDEDGAAEAMEQHLAYLSEHVSRPVAEVATHG